jgi:flavocytochrome c
MISWSLSSALYITGPLDGLTCDSESVQQANSAQLHSILSEIADTTFFRLVRVNSDNTAYSFCPINELRPSSPETGSCGAVVDAFDTFAPKAAVSTFDPFGGTSSFGGVSSHDDDHSHGGGLCSVEPEKTPQSIAETVVTHISPEEVSAQMEFPRDNECVLEGTFQIRPDYWLDICGSETGGEYVNLKLNPERNTGYNGSLVWQEMHKTVMSLQSEEGTVLQRLLSGYHASVTTQIMSSYFPPSSSATKNAAKSNSQNGNGHGNNRKNGRWKSNPKKYAESYFFPHPEYIQDMHFAFVVLGRSLFRIKDFLYSYNFTTGNQTADIATQQLVHHLLDTSVLHTCGSVLSAFDESTMFASNHQEELQYNQPSIYVERLGKVAKEFKKAFRQITRMVNCVTCHRCKLHASVAMHGIGVALKILLTDPVHLVTQSLSRDDIVALVNTVHKFSESIEFSIELVADYYALKATTASSTTTTGSSKSTMATISTKDSQIASPDQTHSVSSLSLARKESLMQFIANHRDNLTRIEEDSLVHALVTNDEKISILGNHFDGWVFVRHALISLGLEVPDAIVVGGGLAGLVTAVSIADRGGSVVVLEKLGALGGNSAKASSGINAVKASDADQVQMFLEDTVKSQNGHGDRNLAKILVESANESVGWLEGITHVNLTSIGQLGGHRLPRTWKPEHGVVGAELMTAMIRAVKQRYPAITVVTHATVTNLLMDESTNEIEGVEYIHNQDANKKHTLYGRNIVLASGGFGFDSEGMLKKYRPDLVSFPTTLGAHTTGDGIRFAESIGAELVDMEYVQLHPTGFIDPTDRDNHVKVLAAEVVRGIGGVLLNRDGKRFVNELGTRKFVTDMMLASPDREFWLVIGSRSVPQAERLLQIYVSRGLLHNVTSEQELTKLIGGSAVIDALKQYSEDSVDALGRKDRSGLPMHDVPYWLVGEVTPVVHYTMGGIKIDDAGRVLRRDGSAIDRLYAVGEVSGGVHGENRLGGNSLLECTVFGRIIGGKSIIVHEQLTPSHFPRRNPISSLLLTGNDSQGQGKPSEIKLMSMKDVESHNTVADCWTVIEGKVYDLSSYAEDHPGGASAIKESCGKDSTKRFLVAHTLGLLEDADFLPIGKIA